MTTYVNTSSSEIFKGGLIFFFPCYDILLPTYLLQPSSADFFFFVEKKKSTKLILVVIQIIFFKKITAISHHLISRITIQNMLKLTETRFGEFTAADILEFVYIIQEY